MTHPDVSIVVGVYNAMPYLVRCLESVEAQTLGADRIELIAVDDGSTDDSGDYLEKFAAKSRIPTRVIRQANSGGPSGPRNVGLGLARGRFVFFLDADDYLGEEALERMVGAADRNATDVVLGKVIGVNRSAPKSMWKRSLERTDVFSSNIKYTLSAQKLFRRDLLVRHDMSFPEELKTGEDAVFTMEAYLRADGISVVADYTCYYLVGREDGQHVTKSGGYILRFDSAGALTRLIAEHVPRGGKRDLLMVRPFVITLLPQFGPGLLKESEEIQRHKLELAKPLMDAYWTDGLARGLRVHERLRLYCVSQGRLDLLKEVLEFIRARKEPLVLLDPNKRAAYLMYPHFRDAAAGIPDAVYANTRDPLPADKLRWQEPDRRLGSARNAVRRALSPRLIAKLARSLEERRARGAA